MVISYVRRFAALTLWLSTVLTNASPHEHERDIHLRQASDRLVFCHFMVFFILFTNATISNDFQIGIVSNRHTAADYDDDMKRAKAIGIDAFALNIGKDSYTDQQLQLAYESAANNGMKVFISFDFNWFSTGEAANVGNMIKNYGSKPAQLLVDNKIFASSFAGDTNGVLDVDAVRAAAGGNVYFAPNFHPGLGSASKIDGALNWMVGDL